MRRVWNTIVGYIWWTYPRGSVHYDVMVTLILLFIFLAPLRINFNDKPVARVPHPSEVAVYPDGQDLVFHVAVDEKQLRKDASDGEVRAYLHRVIEPIAGEIAIERYEPVKERGRVVAYKAWVRR